MQWVINARIGEFLPKAEAYLEPCQTSKIEFSAQCRCLFLQNAPS